jgi:hypothetical protein
MLIPFSMIALGTRLVITVADGVPKFDIARGAPSYVDLLTGLQGAKLAGQLPK